MKPYQTDSPSNPSLRRRLPLVEYNRFAREGRIPTGWPRASQVQRYGNDPDHDRARPEMLCGYRPRPRISDIVEQESVV
jgi:hypothetical protein